MKKVIVSIVSILLIVATVWMSINYKKITVVQNGLLMLPMIYFGTWNDELEMFINSNGSEAYRECDCTGEECKYLPEDLLVFHKYVPSYQDGEWTMYSEYPYTDLEVINNSLYKDAVCLESRLDAMSDRWECLESNKKPEFPEAPELKEYVGGNDNTLSEISGFFSWLGNCFLFLFRIVLYFFNWIEYYAEFIYIFFEELNV